MNRNKLLWVGAGVLAAAASHAPYIQAQSSPAPAPKWEVVSVRACAAGIEGQRGGGPSRFSPGRAVWDCQFVQGLVNAAYLLAPRGMGASIDTPITGGPSWIRSDRYYIQAKAEGTPSTKEMQGPMLQAILEDRFKLRIHWETREVPVYALVVAKGGPRLRPFKEGTCTRRDIRDTNELPPHPPSPGEKLCSNLTTIKGSDWTMDAQAMTLEGFSKSIGIALGRTPVIDRTGITGLFEFHLVWANDNAQGEPSDAPSIFTVVEQLGLKLEPTKGPGEFLVIDSVERPSGN
jgi:uncharacterized protein (TIGR03435 family)